MRKSISSMYFATTAALLIASTAVMGLIQMYLVMGYFKNDKRESLTDVVNIASTQFQSESQLREALIQNPDLAQAVQKSMALISETSSTTIFLPTKRERWCCAARGQKRESGQNGTRLRAARRRERQGFFETGTLGGLYPGRYYTAGGAVRDGSGGVRGVCVRLHQRREPGRVRERYVFQLYPGCGADAAGLQRAGDLFTTRLTTPLRRISEAARKFGGGDFSVRVPVDGDDEVAQLAITFNNMARNLETIDSSRASFMGNIAHELRTP